MERVRNIPGSEPKLEWTHCCLLSDPSRAGAGWNASCGERIQPWPCPTSACCDRALLIGNHWNSSWCVTCSQDLDASCAAVDQGMLMGSLEPPACSQPHPLCKQIHSVGQDPCQQNRIQRFCAPICQHCLLRVFLLEKELQLMWSSGLQLKGCVLVSTTHLFARSVWVNAASVLVWAHPSGFDRAHVSETRRIWVPVNYDSWHLTWNKDQIWDGFLPSCCI